MTHIEQYSIQTMIEFDHITKRYGRTSAVADLSLTVAPGELLALVGPNGAGKTTLIRMLLGLVRPTSGTARIAGYDAQREGIAARQQIGYLPQRAILYGNLTVAENLAFLSQLRDVPMQRVGEVLDLVRLDHETNQPVRTLSGGMLQRLGLAQALLADPPALILDEPTASLDPQSVANFKALLRDLHTIGKTVLLSSHILGDVQELADRVAILNQGRLVAVDSVAGLAARCDLPERMEVELAAVTGAEAALAERMGATARLHGTTLEIAVSAACKPALIQALLSAGLPIRDLRSSSPTLEAIFLQLVGQQYHAEV